LTSNNKFSICSTVFIHSGRISYNNFSSLLTKKNLGNPFALYVNGCVLFEISPLSAATLS